MDICVDGCHQRIPVLCINNGLFKITVRIQITVLPPIVFRLMYCCNNSQFGCADIPVRNGNINGRGYKSKRIIPLDILFQTRHP